MPTPEPPPCDLCGQLAYNINGNGEYTGKHTDLSECLREMGRRIWALERLVRKPHKPYPRDHRSIRLD